MGRPSVNASGDVVFAAQVSRGDEQELGEDDTITTAAGIFLFRAGTLTVVIRSGANTAAGEVDLVAPIDPNADPTEVVERTPALNDAGDVAFLTGIHDDQHGGAIFIARGGTNPVPVVRTGDPYDGGTFATLGEPALNGSRLIAFHGTVTGAPESPFGMVDGVLDAIFTAGPDGAPITPMVVEGTPVMPLDEPLLTFGDDVSLNDAGDAVFLAGPLNANSYNVDPTDDAPGVVLSSGGVVTAVAYPDEVIDSDRLSAFRLGPAEDSAVVPPVIDADGRVAFIASVNGGTSEAVGLWSGGSTQRIRSGGRNADETPVGGTYAGATSGVAIDANGAVVFRARVAGGTSSEGLVYQPATPPGAAVPLPASVIVVGDAAPDTGYFAGKPFSAPVLNDAGDVVFRAFLARTAASAGIFRLHAGTLSPLVRTGDPVPGTPEDSFLDLAGQPTVNQSGAVAFAAQIPGGLGIFVSDANGIRRIVSNSEQFPGEGDVTFRSISQNPAIDAAGHVAFRARTVLANPAPDGHPNVQGIFLADGAGGIRRLVQIGDPSPTGDPFFRLHDPVITDTSTVFFRASLGVDAETSTGIFSADGTGVHAVAVAQQDLGAGISILRVTGDPVVTRTGQVAFLATRTRALTDTVHKMLGPSILETTADGLGLVIAQDMPGPAGGTFHSLSTPAVSGTGHVVFRGSFLALTGGTGGIFIADDDGLQPYLASGEASPVGGRFSSYGNRFALNAGDDLAFTATVSGGSAPTGIFLASRTALAVRPIQIQLTHGTRARLRMRLGLTLGHISDGVDTATEPVHIGVSDESGVLWSITVNADRFKKRGKALVASTRSKKHPAPGSVRIEPTKAGVPTVSVALAAADLGTRTLDYPVSVTLQIGDDSATRVLPCRPGRHGIHCSAH